MLVAAVGGLFAVIALGFGARALLRRQAGRGDRAPRARRPAGDIPIIEDKPDRTVARLARILRPLRPAGEALGRRGDVAHQPEPHPRRLSQRQRGRDLPRRQVPAAADRHPRAVADRRPPRDADGDDAAAIAVAFIAIAIAFFLPNIWLSRQDHGAASRRSRTTSPTRWTCSSPASRRASRSTPR